jgi:capsid protein
MIEGHRIETPFDRYTDEGHSMIDGVEFREVTKGGQSLMDITGYQVRVGFGAFESQSRWVPVPKEAIFHIFNAHRANQFRGISDFYACENALGKLEELVKMEMRAQDTQSDWAVLVKNAAGQFNPIDPKLQAVAVARGQNQPPSQTDPEKLTSIVEMYRKIYGGNTRAFKLNEDAQMMAPNRPAEATLQLWEFLINCVCAGAHAPRCLVFGKISAASAKSQGTEVRGELDSADAFYRGDFTKWQTFVRGSVEYFMEWAIRNDPRVADPPANWRSCIHIQQPEACNVDVGHTTQAALMLLAAGASDYDMILGPMGISFQHVARKLSRQQKLLERLDVKVTLPGLMKGQIPLDGAKPNQPQEAETSK